MAVIISYHNLLLSLSRFHSHETATCVTCYAFGLITSVVQRDCSLRGSSVTFMTYQCCPYKSVTSNSLLLEALCSMLGENNGESACKERQRTRLDPAEN